ncbi:MAG: response regulator [Thermotogae bacterium]|nr:response regulator [Thermotogota bacterium]MCP5465133.1 response regulator [Thermotogota bacterium]
MKNNKKILLAEDDIIDVMTIKRALKEINITNPLIIKENGEEALNYLMSIEKNEYPCIIISDINMPKLNGIEFLKEIKKNDKLKRIPFVILTTSKEEADKCESFNLGVSGYMIKPVDYINFVEVVKTINLYWTISELPD